MYGNVASGFIMGFVSPVPSFSGDDESRDSGSNYGAPHENNMNEVDGGGHEGLFFGASNITSLCESYLSMSEAAVNGSGGGFPPNYPPYNNNFERVGDNDDESSAGSWESGNRNDWTIAAGNGDVLRRPPNNNNNVNTAGSSDNTNNFNNNYHQQFQKFQHHYRNGPAAGGSHANYGGEHKGGDSSFCPVDWDNILCWPKTAAGEVATLPCFDTLHGIPYNASGVATRLCMEGGIWNRTEYSGCKPFTTLPNITTDTGNLDITTGIYLFGYCLSLVALIIAAVIFISFKELRCLRNTIHSHLMVTYVLSNALWVLGVISSLDQGRNVLVRHTTQATCFSFILLHYFHLTNFFWMFVEGLYLYVLVVQTFMTESIRLRTYCLIGWGLPLLVVLVWSVSKWATMNIEPGEKTMKMMQMAEVEFNSVVCPWLHANQYDWIYIASALIVLAANLVFLLQIMWVLITKLRSATSQETQQSRKAAKALVVLMPLLGVTYLLTLIGSRKWPAFEHIRAFLLSTQGFLVALLYCFLNAEVRMAIRHRWNRMENFRADLKCCCCCGQADNSHTVQTLRDWSPRSRTESIRLYTPTSHNYRKRESSASETTTMTAVGCSSFNGSGHAMNATAGNGNTTLITSMTGRKISTTPLRPTAFSEESDLV